MKLKWHKQREKGLDAIFKSVSNSGRPNSPGGMHKGLYHISDLQSDHWQSSGKTQVKFPLNSVSNDKV